MNDSLFLFPFGAAELITYPMRKSFWCVHVWVFTGTVPIILRCLRTQVGDAIVLIIPGDLVNHLVDVPSTRS